MHILLIARHYPPEISGGARRPLLYTNALRNLGHRVTLVTPFKLDDSDSITVENEAINRGIQRLNSTSKPLKADTLRARLIGQARIWRYWPDDNINWAQSVITAVKQSRLKPDWIMTTSPPESIHIAGQALSSHMSVRWVAEFRDTWVEHPHRKILAKSKFRAFIERRIARKTLQQADALLAVSEAVMREARTFVRPNTPECIISHFSNPPQAIHKFDPEGLHLVHTGGFTLSDRRRALAPLLETLDSISAKRPNLVFHITGPLSDVERDMIKTARTTIEWHGPVSLEQARAMQAGADGLVLYTPPDSHALPGKYAEYIQAGRPILYKGGGSWTNLVDDTATLRPLKSAGLTLKKNELIDKSNALTDMEAARTLVDFLEGPACASPSS